MLKGRLGYNQQNDRYGILSMDLWENDGLHCGETLEVKINDEWKADRIEYSHKTKEWYLVHSKIKGADLEYLQVRY